ncbi:MULTISPECIES: redoxin family protein [unclassified Sporosarcina]|uniref:redoxin family protein n=1 Tax=unclassified Sporosarcina TaxID=2647733 RepID=UPI000C171068|nr:MULTISPECIES: redoxin family protein [unclassified Sporosarcina]PID07291.1 thioredoxin [Sporosarcina sp. P30]PID10487.1 thioredoxin [Sporosarcina sp. P31]PID13072.1 thioredoxin [Sporosarcina sp. P32b]
MLKKIVMLLAIVAVLGACSSAGTDSDANSIALQDLHGKTVSLADYKGEKVYVKFWASWCPICLAGLDEVNTLAKESTDFEVLTVVAPGFNNEKPHDEFVKWFKGVQHVDALPVLLNDGGSLVQEFNVKGYPTSAFIDTKGKLVRSQPGHLSNDQIIDAMSQIN